MTAFIFLLIGGVEALLMRMQLATARQHVPERRTATTRSSPSHGTTMMFLFAVPVMEGMGIYLVPLMLGTRNVAFPRLNASATGCTCSGGLLLYAGVFTNTIPMPAGSPIRRFPDRSISPGKGVDVWAQMITFTEISALCVAVELIVTILKMRAPGMSLNRMPMFCWSCWCSLSWSSSRCPR